MSEAKTLAILMLCYNGGEDAIEAIKSLKDQRALIEDIFISDNNSNDGTKKLLRENERELDFHFVERHDNLGFASGFNDLFRYALEHTKADYFLVLNNDTEAEEGFIEALLKEADPDRVVSPMILWHRDKKTVIQCAGRFDQEMMKMDNLFADKQREEVPEGVHEVEQTDGCCFLIHRKWPEQGFFFDDSLFIYFEDVDLFWRLRKAGVRFYYVTSSVLYHKEYGSSGGRDKPSAFRNYYFYRNRMALVSRMHAWPGRLRVYWRLYQLAKERQRQDAPVSEQAAKAIGHGMWDALLGKMGRRYQP